MKLHGTILIDWALQLAALIAVLFVLHAGVAYGALPAERTIIAESLRAGLSPSVALAVAAAETSSPLWRNPEGIRYAVTRLRDAIDRHPGRLGTALRAYGGDARFVEAVQVLRKRYDAAARTAARSLAVPSRNAQLDDFGDGGLILRARRAGRALDDFPLAAGRG